MKTTPNESLTPICDFVRDYAASGISRFHMPGHKGRGEGSSLGLTSLFPLDITEIEGADSLYLADGIIQKSEQIASGLFGTGRTFFSAEGSSLCIRAMLALLALRKKEPVILAARNVHSSFISACCLLGIRISWLLPETDCHYVSSPIPPRKLYEVLSQSDEKPDAVYVTSPDYTGNLQDIAGIADAAHAFGIPLLVDNAHGAYLHFLKEKQHPMDLGADMCCDSAHKTLPALTGCAYLHISKTAPSFFAANARKCLSLFGSTSPSYLLLASLDRLNEVLSGDYPSLLESAAQRTLQLKKALSFHGFSLNPSPSSEPLKITVFPQSKGLSGKELSSLLRSFGIECEFADQDLLVIMTSPGNREEDFEKLESAMKKISEKYPRKKSPDGPLFPPMQAPKQILSLKEAMFSPSEQIPVEKAAGRICADLSVSCPPAVPIVLCGELITAGQIPVLQHYGFQTIRVVSGR